MRTSGNRKESSLVNKLYRVELPPLIVPNVPKTSFAICEGVCLLGENDFVLPFSVFWLFSSSKCFKLVNCCSVNRRPMF